MTDFSYAAWLAENELAVLGPLSPLEKLSPTQVNKRAKAGPPQFAAARAARGTSSAVASRRKKATRVAVGAAIAGAAVAGAARYGGAGASGAKTGAKIAQNGHLGAKFKGRAGQAGAGAVMGAHAAGGAVRRDVGAVRRGAAVPAVGPPHARKVGAKVRRPAGNHFKGK